MLDIFERHPQLRAAVQPPKLPRREGTFRHTPAAVFAELEQRVAAGTFRLRAPAKTFDGLVAFRGTGTCLAPVLTDDYLFIDPTLEPADGDFVIVHLDPEELAGIIDRGRDDPEWLATYGPNPGPNVTKLLHACGADWYLQDRETAFPLAGYRAPRNNWVLGVVRKVKRGAWTLYEDGANALQRIPPSPAPAHCLQIGLNAATITDIAHATPAGVSLTGVTGVTELNPTMTMTNSPKFDCTAIATINITAAQTTGTVGDVTLLIVFADDNVTHVNSTSVYKVLSSSNQQYTLQWEFSHLGTNAGLGKVWAAADPGATTDTLVYGPCTLQVEYIQR